MNIDDIIDYSTWTSICICIIGWILILITIPLLFFKLELAQVLFVSGMVIMVVGMFMGLVLEPMFRLVYKYLSKKD